MNQVCWSFVLGQRFREGGCSLKSWGLFRRGGSMRCWPLLGSFTKVPGCFGLAQSETDALQSLSSRLFLSSEKAPDGSSLFRRWGAYWNRPGQLMLRWISTRGTSGRPDRGGRATRTCLKAADSARRTHPFRRCWRHTRAWRHSWQVQGSRGFMIVTSCVVFQMGFANG